MVNLLHQLAEGRYAGRRRGVAEHAGGANVIGRQIGQGAAAAVLELGPTNPVGRRREIGMAGAGLQLGLLIRSEHVLVAALQLPVPSAAVELQHPGCLPAKSGSRRKIHERCRDAAMGGSRDGSRAGSRRVDY